MSRVYVNGMVALSFCLSFQLTIWCPVIHVSGENQRMRRMKRVDDKPYLLFEMKPKHQHTHKTEKKKKKFALVFHVLQFVGVFFSFALCVRVVFTFSFKEC